MPVNLGRASWFEQMAQLRSLGVSRTSSVYVDENGTFTSKLGDVSGIAALVCPGKPPWDEMADLVGLIEKGAEPGERNAKGEPKGAKLLRNRYPKLLEFAKKNGLLLYQFIVKEEQIPDSKQLQKRREEFAKVFPVKAAEIGRDREGQDCQVAMTSVSEVEFLIVATIQSVFGHGIVAELASKGIPDDIPIVYDPRCCSQGFGRMLKLGVNLAFTTQLQASMSRPISATLGDPESPWAVRDAQAHDHPGLMLVDWLAYPKYAAERVDLPQDARLEYKEIVRSFERAGILKYPKFPNSPRP
jgi:hypothetical protein